MCCIFLEICSYVGVFAASRAPTHPSIRVSKKGGGRRPPSFMDGCVGVAEAANSQTYLQLCNTYATYISIVEMISTRSIQTSTHSIPTTAPFFLAAGAVGAFLLYRVSDYVQEVPGAKWKYSGLLSI